MAEDTQDEFIPRTVADLLDYPKFPLLPVDEKIDLIRSLGKQDTEYRKLSDKHRTRLYHKLIPPEELKAPERIDTGQELITPETPRTTKPFSEQMSVPQAIGREALALGTGAVGAVGDILNIPGQLGGAPNRLPIGTQDIQKAIGFEPRTAAERAGTTVGQFVGPGAALRSLGANLLHLPSDVVRAIEPFVSAGLKRDLAMGGVAAGGEEAARQLFPGSEVAPTIARVAGPLGVAATHAALSKGAQIAGKAMGITARQDIQAGKDAATAAGEEVQAAQRALTSTGERTAEDVARAQSELAAVKEGAAAQASQAERQVAQSFVPLEDELGQSILKERTTAGTPRAITQTPPGLQEVGQAAHKEADIGLQVAEGFHETRAREEGKALIESIGPKLERLQVLGHARAGAQKFYEQSRKTIGELFDATEHVTGNAPTVSLDGLRSRAEGMLAEARGQISGATEEGISGASAQATFAKELGGTGEEVPRQTGLLARVGLAKDEVENLFHEGRIPLTKDQEDYLQHFLSDPDMATGLVPFWFARRLESGLSKLAYEGAKPIGNVQQGQARRLLGGLQDDLHNFYQTPEGTEILPQLTEAKQQYANFVQIVNKSIVSKLLSKDRVQVEQFLRPFTTGGQDTTQIELAKQAASPEVWNTLKAYTLSSLYDKAVQATGQFDPQALLTSLKTLRKSGKMGIIFEPEEIASIERYAQSLTATNPTVLDTFRKAILRKAPSEVTEYVFQPGKLEHTQNFKAVSTPDTFDTAVKAWAAKLRADLPDMTPQQIQARMKDLVYRDGKAPSQLDIMLAEYPGVADRMTKMVEGYRTSTRDVAQVAGRGEQAVAEAKSAVATAKARAAAETATQEKAVDYAKASLKDQQDLLAQVKEKYGVPEDTATMHNYMRVAGLHLRSHGPVTAGIMLALDGILFHHPALVGAGVLAAGGAQAFKAFAGTESGRRIIREGLPTRYSPSAIRFAVQSLGAGEPTGPPQRLAAP